MSLFTNLNPNLTPKPKYQTLIFANNPKKLVFTLNCSKNPIRNPNSLSRSLRTLDRLKPYVLSNRRPIIYGWLCSFVSVASLSKIVPEIGNFASLIGGFERAVIVDEGLRLGVLVLARILGGYGQQAFLWEASLRTAFEIRVRVFDGVLDSELGVSNTENDGVLAGDVAYRITAEASDVADTLYALLNTTVPSILQLSAMASQMFAISPVLSLISAMIVPCVALSVAYLGEELRKISKNANLTVAALSAYLNEILPEIPFVKANNAEECESARFRRLASADLSARLRKKKMKAFIPQLIKIVYFGSLFLFFVGSLVISRCSFDSRSVISFVTSLVFLIEPIQGFGKAYNDLKQGESAIERLFDLTTFKSKIKEKSDAVDLDHVTGDVRFSNVSFKYGNDKPIVLDGLNLHIRAGETVAIVGPSGGGKTTLSKLLIRLCDPLSGNIYIDDHDVKDIRLESLRRHVGLVSQDITLLSGTVAENIGYRDLLRGIDMGRVKDAAKTANADEFLSRLPNGYETEVGPRGLSLSGGQRQRLAISRALYQNSSILILDEATSSLDNKSESLVRQAVERLTENHTVLVIAHRLETVMMAKRVFLLNNGKLQELSRSALLSDASRGLVI